MSVQKSSAQTPGFTRRKRQEVLPETRLARCEPLDSIREGGRCVESLEN
jgi:hypothetical protein